MFSFDDEFIEDPVDVYIRNNPDRCGRMYPSFKQLLNEARHNARTMDGTIQVGLPRLLNEVKSLRHDLMVQNRSK